MDTASASLSMWYVLLASQSLGSGSTGAFPRLYRSFQRFASSTAMGVKLTEMFEAGKGPKCRFLVDKVFFYNDTHSMSILISRRLTILGLLILFSACFVVSGALGRYPLSPVTVLRLLASRLVVMEPTWPPQAETVLFQVRLPRIIAATLIGAAMSAAGAAYQGLFRNPLVSPDVLGVSAGAGFGAGPWDLLFDWCPGDDSRIILVWSFCRPRGGFTCCWLPGRCYPCPRPVGHSRRVAILIGPLVSEAGCGSHQCTARHNLLAYGEPRVGAPERYSLCRPLP
jgi:hypothetical protein